MALISDKTVGRLSLYRRILQEVLGGTKEYLFSHELAQYAGVTAAQVRRDIMAIGYAGSPSRGYNIRELLASLDQFIDPAEKQYAVLVGVGNLGRAILSYFAQRRLKIAIQAAFDNDPAKVNRVINNCRCYHLSSLQQIVRENQITVGIISVPPEAAREVADEMVKAGIKGILNFAHVRLRLPRDVWVENIDMATALEKVSYFARQNLG
jgi:redox-sensing transcriptional repressor